ncbi:MAG: hypothetical protein ACREDM_09290 [Methylocella sp.]
MFVIVDRGPAHRAKKLRRSLKHWAENYACLFCLPPMSAPRM